MLNSQAQINSEGLVGYWKLDEGTSNLAYDSSNSENNGILMNGASWVSGIRGNATHLDGVDQYVLVPDSPSLRLQSFTLSAWINMTERPYMHGNRHSCLINKFFFQFTSISFRC